MPLTFVAVRFFSALLDSSKQGLNPEIIRFALSRRLSLVHWFWRAFVQTNPAECQVQTVPRAA
jgi:hypothetical protein